MKMDEVVLPNREKILQLAEQYGARRVRVFGSVARRQDDVESDIDQKLMSLQNVGLKTVFVTEWSMSQCCCERCR